MTYKYYNINNHNSKVMYYLFAGTRLLLRTTRSSHWPFPQQCSGGDASSHASQHWSPNYCRWNTHIYYTICIMCRFLLILLLFIFFRNGTSTVTDVASINKEINNKNDNLHVSYITRQYCWQYIWISMNLMELSSMQSYSMYEQMTVECNYIRTVLKQKSLLMALY